MKEQLKLLIEVQRHDAHIQELDGMLKVWPQKLQALEANVKKVEAMLAGEEAKLAETETWRKQRENEKKDEEDQLQKAKQRSSMVKNVKEMMANERELELNRKQAKEREEDVAKLGEAVESAKARIAQHQTELDALRAHVAGEVAAAQGKIAELEAQLTAARQLRAEAAAAVQPDVLKRYGSIRIRRGFALVPVKNGTCTGCNMNVPPQLFNQLQRSDSVQLCGNCNRMIYWDKLLEETDGEAADSGSKSGR